MLTTTKKISFRGKPISFSENKMINATEMAKSFRKQPAHFLRLKQTKNFITAFQYANKHSEIVKVINGGRNKGTWMHEKLALKFAAWLSPEFELWVFDRIQELLLEGAVAVRPFADGWAAALDEVERMEKGRMPANLLKINNRINEFFNNHGAPPCIDLLCCHIRMVAEDENLTDEFKIELINMNTDLIVLLTRLNELRNTENQLFAVTEKSQSLATGTNG